MDALLEKNTKGKQQRISWILETQDKICSSFENAKSQLERWKLSARWEELQAELRLLWEL